MTWERILKGETIRKGDWDFSTSFSEHVSVSIKNSPFERNILRTSMIILNTIWVQ